MVLASEITWVNCLEKVKVEVDSVTSKSGNHSIRAAKWCQLVAERMGLQGEIVKVINLGALFHDIGKIGVPLEILRKEGPLTRREWSLIELHPTIGANIVRSGGSMASVVSIIQAHQEWFDGRGYPDRVGGDTIPLGARILAVVDAYDAMTDDRPYREARSPEEAVREIIRNRGRQFDPQVVDVFVNLLHEKEIVTGLQLQSVPPVS